MEIEVRLTELENEVKILRNSSGNLSQSILAIVDAINANAAILDEGGESAAALRGIVMAQCGAMGMPYEIIAAQMANAVEVYSENLNTPNGAKSAVTLKADGGNGNDSKH